MTRILAIPEFHNDRKSIYSIHYQIFFDQDKESDNR